MFTRKSSSAFKASKYGNKWRVTNNPNIRTLFENIIIELFPTMKIYTPAEYKAYKDEIKANKTKGIRSLKKTIKRVRKS